MKAGASDIILVLRRAAGMTQADLAARLGITQAALSRYENNLRQPDEDTTARIATVLGVTPQFLEHDFRMRDPPSAPSR